MSDTFSLGLDFGTNSVRALLLDADNGIEICSAIDNYASGENGIISNPKNPHLARQHPGDYQKSMVKAVQRCLEIAKSQKVNGENIKGIGIDTTGSTPLPITKNLTPLALIPEFKNNPNAQAWLWKDHTSVEEALEITELASKIRPQYLKKCGGAYSSEWFFSKIFHCYKVDKKVFKSAYSWIELSDYIPALLSGISENNQVKRNICAAGHKAMYNDDWGGLPDEEFLKNLSPDLAQLRNRLFSKAYTSDNIAGYLCDKWAQKLNLKPAIPIGVGALDAHIGGVGSGVGKGILVKIIGTSTCDIMVYPLDQNLPDIPGLAGIVNGSVLPGYTGIEAGQSAVGDIFNWFVTRVLNKNDDYHQVLSKKASNLRTGQSGLIALDWNNGNRNILADSNLSGLIIGQTLQTSDFEIYRALIEATAFGARRIIERIEEYGLKINKVINCGGIAEKNPLVMQIYANVLNRPMEVAANPQTVALGSAIIGAVAGLKGKQGYENVEAVQKRVCKVKEHIFKPENDEVHTYNSLYKIYKLLHNGFGINKMSNNYYPVMKKLLMLKSAFLAA